MNGRPTLRVGTRGSVLARWQAEWVAARLSEQGAAVELVLITTQGDQQQSGPIGAIGAQGVFTKEIQRALLDGQVDVAVHSLKDLPTDTVEGLVLAAVPEREAAGDALVSRDHASLDDLSQAATVGTGSLRRKAQLLHARPDLEVHDVRGNIDTRLTRLDEGRYAALILAEAGLRRLNRTDRIRQVLPKSIMLPAVGQGALGLEARADDEPTQRVLAALDHPASHQAVAAERALLSHLRGGCLAPVGAWARMEGGQLRLTATVLSHDGRQKLVDDQQAAPEDAVDLGRRVADSLLSQGAADLIEASRTAS